MARNGSFPFTIPRNTIVHPIIETPYAGQIHRVPFVNQPEDVCAALLAVARACPVRTFQVVRAGKALVLGFLEPKDGAPFFPCIALSNAAASFFSEL